MAKPIGVTDYSRVSYRVRILRDGLLITTVYINEYDTACDWAYNELKLSSLATSTTLLAAVIEEGVRFEGMFGENTVFASNGKLRDGIVLDKSILRTVDRNFLFGLS